MNNELINELTDQCRHPLKYAPIELPLSTVIAPTDNPRLHSVADMDTDRWRHQGRAAIPDILI